MARKPVTDEFSPFPHRLALLMKERGLRQQDLAQELGVKRQTVSLYTSGQSTPDALILKQIAKYFNVSADWLLGLSEIRSPDPQLSAVCDYTGLNEEAAELLHQWNQDDDDREMNLKVLEKLLGEPGFYCVLSDLFLYQEKMQVITALDLEHASSDKLMDLERKMKAEKYLVTDTFSELLDTLAEMPDWKNLWYIAYQREKRNPEADNPLQLRK